MNEFDDLFESVKVEPAANDVSVAFDLEDWKSGKRAERDQAYSLIRAMTETVGKNAEKLKSYLDIQSRFDQYSVGNALLIAAQSPDAIRLADFDTWKKEGKSIKKGETGIMIIEPGKEYTREDGSVGVSYNVKKVFDITQTNSESDSISAEAPDMRLLVKALMFNAPCGFSIDNDGKLPEGRIAMYIPEDRAIYVLKGADPGLLFENIAGELALSVLDHDGKDVLDKSFTANCVAYMLCRRYGLDTERFTFDSIPDGFCDGDEKAVRTELGVIRDVMNTITENMQKVFEKETKARDEAR